MIRPCIVKVGGSLLDLADLRDRLRGVIRRLAPRSVLLFPGGGPAADVIRDLDRRFRLGEEASHWLALRALTLNAWFLNTLHPELPVISSVDAAANAIVDPYSLAIADEAHPDHLPHTWQVTSDSLALRAAYLSKAALVLLKSVSMAPGMSWQDAADLGIVDRFFPTAVTRCVGVEVSVVNLRGDSTWSGRINQE